MAQANTDVRRPAYGWLTPLGRASGLALALALIAAIGGYCFFALDQARQASELTLHAQAVLAQLRDVVDASREAADAARLHGTSSGDRYVQQHRGALEKANQAAAAVRELVRGDPAQKQRWDRLEAIIMRGLEETTRQIGRPPGEAAPAIDPDLRDRARAIVGDMVREMLREEGKVLREGTLEAERQAARAQLVLIIGTTVSVALILAVFMLMRREARARAAAEAELTRINAGLEAAVAERVHELRAEMAGRREVEEQLRQALKMEAVGQLTGGVAHDFNNLLLVIMGSLDLADEALGNRPEIREELQRAIRAAERGATLTRSLLAFARRQPLSPSRVDVNQLVRDMVGLLSRTLGEAIEIRLVTGRELWPCEVDAAQLQNALINLAVNARDAMPSGGKLTIETTNAQLDEDYAAQNAEVRPGDYICLAVSDTGTGMPPEVVRRAFDPFFTTKASGKGSGLGLSMIYGFVKQSDGHVKIYSEVGHGTTIKLYLPHSSATAAVAAATADGDAIRGGSETVLVVEDDIDVRSLAVKQLAGLGYRAIEAVTADAALAVLDEQPVDLLLTDVVLAGGMNGRELADRARANMPGLRVLYMSGYTENAILHHGRLDPGVQLLQKPFRLKDLATKVRIALDTK